MRHNVGDLHVSIKNSWSQINILRVAFVERCMKPTNTNFLCSILIMQKCCIYYCFEFLVGGGL